MWRKGGHGVSVGRGVVRLARRLKVNGAKLTIQAAGASGRSPSHTGLTSSPEYTYAKKARLRGERREIWYFLRVAIAASVAGGRRTQAVSGCTHATGDRGPAWLRLRLGRGTSFPGRIFALAFAGIFSCRREPAH